jgi:ribosomal protein S19
MRSCWKIPFISQIYLKKYFLKKNIFNIKYKNSIINQNFVDKKVNIHNGNFEKKINILQNMVGFKFGEFILFKTFTESKHINKQKSKKK